jgi:hypothetical protein
LKKRFTEEQIIGFLKQAEAGVAVKDVKQRAKVTRWGCGRNLGLVYAAPPTGVRTKFGAD